MKTLVYGAGAVGSYYAARIAQSGQEVAILARGDRADWIEANGIELENLTTGVRTTTDVPVVHELRPDERYDLVIVALPKNHLSEALPRLAANPHLPDVLFLGNSAAGPDEQYRALGRQRVLLGFPGVAGTRANNRVRYVDTSAGRRIPTHIGGRPGALSARIDCISSILRRAGMPVEVVPDMASWLQSHIAVMLPLAGALYLANCDVYRLARTRDGLVLMARGFRESLQVLDILNIPIAPPRLRLYQWMPEPIVVSALRRSLRRSFTQLTLAHAECSRDEMEHLATEFSELASQAGYATPVMDFLYGYANPEAAPLADGSARLGVNWRDVWIAGGVVASIAAGIRLLRWLAGKARKVAGE